MAQDYPEVQEDLKPTSPKKYREATTRTVRIDNNLVVKIHKHDVPELVLKGIMPLTLFNASLEFQRMQAKESEDANKTDSLGEQLAFLEKVKDTGFLDFLRKYAASTVIEPPIVMDSKDAGDNAIWVEELTLNQLMRIHEVGNDLDRLPAVERPAAEEFRRPKPADDGAPVPRWEDVREATEFVDRGERETITH